MKLSNTADLAYLTGAQAFVALIVVLTLTLASWSPSTFWERVDWRHEEARP